MKVGIIQATTQAEKNALLYRYTKRYARGWEVVNFGCFMGEKETYSYIETAVMAGLLLSSRAVDFIVTGCSSGQGMMLACNNMPDVLCGYAPTPRDAYLFAQINDGNAISLPLGENYTYAGEENLAATIEALFSEPFGQGWPKEHAERKLRDTRLLKLIRRAAMSDTVTLLDRLDDSFVRHVFGKTDVMRYIAKNGAEETVVQAIKDCISEKGML